MNIFLYTTYFCMLYMYAYYLILICVIICYTRYHLLVTHLLVIICLYTCVFLKIFLLDSSKFEKGNWQWFASNWQWLLAVMDLVEVNIISTYN